VADRTEIEFRRSLDALVPPGTPIVAAVSGGADSVALLHLLVRAARPRGLAVVVAHLDHALRRGSRADRGFVERLAAELDLDCVADRRDVAAARRRDESPEEAARRVRRAFLVEAMHSAGAALVATGHTLDDQAETILLRLARGTGPAAAGGMRPVGPGPFVRPLLGHERTELRGWLERRGLGWREDPSNRDLHYDRNRVRHLALPALVEAVNPRAARHVVEAAGRIREDAALLDGLAADLLERLAGRDGRGRLAIDAVGLAAAPPPIARRAAHLALRRAGVDARRIGARHVSAVLDLAARAGPAEVHLPCGLRARRSRSRILFLVD